MSPTPAPVGLCHLNETFQRSSTKGMLPFLPPPGFPSRREDGGVSESQGTLLLSLSPALLSFSSLHPGPMGSFL